MTEDADSYTQAEIVRLLNSLTANVSELRLDLKRLEANYVTRAEWSLWKEAHVREMNEMRKDVEGSQPTRTSGWAIASVIVSSLVGLGSILTLAIVLIQNVR
jgi:hypothetical protein